MSASTSASGAWPASARFELPAEWVAWSVPAEHGTLCGAIAELLTLIEDAEVHAESTAPSVLLVCVL